MEIEKGKRSPSLYLHLYPPSTSAGLLLHLQYYQKWEFIILKMCVKSEKVKGANYSFFRKLTLTVNLKELSSNTIFWCYTLGKFYIVKFDCFRERENKVKEGFEIFLIDHYAGDIQNKNVSGKY